MTWRCTLRPRDGGPPGINHEHDRPTAPTGPAQDRDRGGGSLRRWVPGLGVIATYRRQWLAKDIIAGVVLTTLLVPRGMAYAELAGLPPITGVYTSVMSARRGSWCWAWTPRSGR